jgi:DNA-directed RNA polymerase subunit L
VSFQEKNESNNNEMSKSQQMASIEAVKTSNKGNLMTCELKNVPVSFVNALRRTLLHGLPTVVLRDVQILENTTQIPHEMLKHRVEMLPVDVQPTDAGTIKDAAVELHILADKGAKDIRIITTDDFKIEGAREKILMRDRDLDTPLLFLKMRPNETVHIKAKLSVESLLVSQVCTASTRWHVDEERAKAARKAYEEAGNDVRVFDNTLHQREYSRDEKGRPNWFDLSIESVGVIPSLELLKMALSILRKSVLDYMAEALENIQREADEGSYTISLEQGGHTVGYLVQETMYSDANVNFVAYNIPHPLRNTMVLKFNTKKSPEAVLNLAKTTIEEYCSVVEKGL